MDQTKEKLYSLEELTGGNEGEWFHYILDKNKRPMMSLCGIELKPETFCPAGSTAWYFKVKKICPDCHFIAKSRKL